ncbi:MAG: UvrD-helicase domain-containing protein, partial [Muribaculaceae bacterium]|nr:UvrD-helicase domain-containing protein [Muribaculaceae bacterium]
MSGQTYLSELNEAQRAAVEYLDGPELVIAGAGSGKTRVLTYKIVHLLANGHSAGNILALTFTNKAAQEMRERISGLVGETVASRLWMGTFHSVFSRFLRMNADKIGFSPNFTIYDAADSKSLIKSIIRDLKLDDKVYRPAIVASVISNAKNNLYSAADYASDRDIRRSDEAAGRPRTADIFRIYVERCRIAGAMDFDDLLYYTNVLFRDFPEVLERYRRHFTYVLVDEYQDTNFAQHLIVRQLCERSGAICVVGDDAQSIYSFRGADIRNILSLKKTFPALRTFKLEQNYRSTRNIIGAANTLIAANTEQIPKEVFSRNDEGERIEVVQSYSDYEEAYTVATRLSQVRMRYHLALNDVAILYRTNAQSRVLEEALRNRNVPYRVYGGLAFFQRKEIKDAVCFFRLAVNPDDDEAFRRVINTPK